MLTRAARRHTGHNISSIRQIIRKLVLVFIRNTLHQKHINFKGYTGRFPLPLLAGKATGVILYLKNSGVPPSALDNKNMNNPGSIH